jgi:hypothetical protein
VADQSTPGDWRKSQRSGDTGCVEWRRTGDTVEVRDSNDRTGPVLPFSTDAWQSFIAGVKVGEFDRPA